MRLELAKIDADIEALERTVDEAAALSTQAELQVTRRERAVREGGVSATELEDARTALAAAAARAARAEADVTAARSTRDRIRQRIEDLEVRAPFAGSVVAKLVEVGEWIDTGDAVVELVELDPIDAWLEVPERYIDDVESASSIEVVVESLGVSVVGAEVAIVAQANELSRTFPVRVRVPNVSGALKPGMSVSAMIPTGLRENAVTVRKDALLRDDAGTFVYFDAGGMAMAARVERLWGVGDRVVIRSDALRPGMKVVIEGNERMYPTQPIVDIDAPPAAPGGGGGTVDAKGGR
jgi:RND family efflux transporter MFP subunit